jgi:glycerate kinase
MKMILAPDSFKGSLAAHEVCRAMAAGARKALPDAELVLIPMADGGEGTVQSLVAATQGRIIRRTVTGPLSTKVDAFFGILGDEKTAVVEMAAASGLPLVPEGQRNPMITTTFGTGELIRYALDEGCTRLIIGIGGSATNDGGTGMATALGYRFLDSEARELSPGGGALIDLTRIDYSERDPRLAQVEVIVACDVTNPLTGPSGAAAVYGPQKGATPEMIPKLDMALNNLARVIERDLRIKVAGLPGAGAAGGMGAGTVAFLSGRLRPGVEIVLEAVDFWEKIKGADLVVTGEGAIDSQTVHGKTPIGVARAAKRFNIPVLAVTGGLGEGWESVLQHGIDGVTPITDRPMALHEAMLEADRLITAATERIIRVFLTGFHRGRNG